MMLHLLYELLLGILAVLALPKFLYDCLLHKKYRTNFLLRLGVGFPRIEKGSKPLIWLHAVSVGETKAIAPLARLICAQMPEAVLVISSVTETGHAEALRSIPFAHHHVYLPFDFLFIVRPIVRKARPDVFILCETDFWYNFLDQCKKCGAKIFLVNGKLSERSAQRYAKLPFVVHALFSPIDRFCVQNALYAKRFADIGIPSEKIEVLGNLKFDGVDSRMSADECAKWKISLGIEVGQPVVVLGSTHDPEEKLLLQALQVVWERFPQLKVLVVPRHPERFSSVFKFIQSENISCARLSNLAAKTGHERVVVIDALGVLLKCYQIADVAVVCGSFTPRVGGHNILEPCAYAVPVVFGPHMHGQRELVEWVIDNQVGHAAGLQVSLDALPSTLMHLLAHPELRQQIGQAGVHLVQSQRGSTKKTWEVIREVSEKK